QPGELHGASILERERRRRNEIERLVVALESERRVELPERQRERRRVRRRTVDDEVVDLDRRRGRSAVRRFEMRRQLAEQVELIGPGPEQAQRELGSERRALREIAVVAGRSHREAGDRERRRLFRRARYLCRHAPPSAAEE